MSVTRTGCPIWPGAGCGPSGPQLKEALTGRFTEHHAMLCRLMLDRIDQLNAVIDELDRRIDTQMQPFRAVRARLSSIPGVAQWTAEVIIAETGADMSRFPDAAHLSSWADMCPGNNESASKHFSGRTRKGDRWLAAALARPPRPPPAWELY